MIGRTQVGYNSLGNTSNNADDSDPIDDTQSSQWQSGQITHPNHDSEFDEIETDSSHIDELAEGIEHIEDHNSSDSPVEEDKNEVELSHPLSLAKSVQIAFTSEREPLESNNEDIETDPPTDTIDTISQEFIEPNSIPEEPPSEQLEPLSYTFLSESENPDEIDNANHEAFFHEDFIVLKLIEEKTHELELWDFGYNRVFLCEHLEVPDESNSENFQAIANVGQISVITTAKQIPKDIQPGTTFALRAPFYFFQNGTEYGLIAPHFYPTS